MKTTSAISIILLISIPYILSAVSETEAKTLMNKYLPTVYFHGSEQYFPSKIENFGINWNTVSDWSNTEGTVSYSYTGPSSLDQSVPIYTSVKTQDDGTIRITYAFLYAFNGCGPKLDVKVKALWITYYNDSSSVCPAGKHWGDLEHISVILDSNRNLKYFTYAYHDGSNDYSSSDITWESGYPVVYAANGSHASYKGSGTQNYNYFWDYSKSSAGTRSYGVLQDFTGNTYRWRTTNPRLLKVEGNAASDISTDEYNMAIKYYGRLGVQMTNAASSSAVSALRTASKWIGKISKSVSNSLNDAIDAIEGEYNSPAPNSLPKKGWW